MEEKICRLCLQTINGNYQPIGQSLANTLKLNLDITKEAVKCIECTNNLEVLFKFKSACDYMRQPQTEVIDNMSLDPEKTEIKVNLISFSESKDETRCCFCTKASERESLTSLNESKKHKFLLDALKEHIPKMNSYVTEELLMCQTCLDRWQPGFHFVMKYSDTEEKINKYLEIKGTTDEGQIDLKDVQQFIFEPTVKFEIESMDVNEVSGRWNQFQEGYTIQAEAEIKQEEGVENPELFIKTEDVDIKSEHSDCESFQEPPTPFKIDNETLDISSSTKIEIDDGLSDISAPKSRRRSKNYVSQHESIYINSDGITMYKCITCQYEAKRKYYLRRHELTHKSISELTMFKCNLCPYEAKRTSNLKRHKLRHKSSSEIRMFKCKHCSYEAKRTDDLKQHELLHGSSSDLTMFKCELCPYKTHRRRFLKLHELTHKNASELQLFKCELCSYEAKRADHLKRHKLLHKSSSDLTMFKCDLCPYEAKYLEYLNRHKLRHKIS